MNYLYLLVTEKFLCQELEGVMGLVGWVILGIKIAVPIILIVVGMMDLAKAVTEKSEDKIKDAQTKLVKKAVAAIAVFLVITLVGLLMGLIGAESWKACNYCLTKPWDTCCKIDSDSVAGDCTPPTTTE